MKSFIPADTRVAQPPRLCAVSTAASIADGR
jgi:hypothetical protein